MNLLALATLHQSGEGRERLREEREASLLILEGFPRKGQLENCFIWWCAEEVQGLGRLQQVSIINSKPPERKWEFGSWCVGINYRLESSIPRNHDYSHGRSGYLSWIVLCATKTFCLEESEMVFGRAWKKFNVLH